MHIAVHNLGKHFNFNWLFRGLTYEFLPGESYAITGPNGSGKSTLIQILAGIIPQSEGELNFIENNSPVDLENYYRHISFASPYLELIEEFTLLEHLHFHFELTPRLDDFSTEEIIEKLYLENNLHKPIKNFSSGMKQRLKLGLAFYSKSEVLFLDEPTSNLDSKGKNWYLENIHKVMKDRIILVASNNPEEFKFCKKELNIPQLK